MNAGLLRSAAALTALLWLLMASPASADTYKPTRFDDPAPGKCMPSDCSLREAIKAANKGVDRDTIVLRKGTYELELECGLNLGRDGLDLFTAIRLRGAGASKTTIDANRIDRPIEVGYEAGAQGPVSIRGLTLTGGDAGAPTACNNGPSGGGIAANGARLTLRDVRVTNNDAVEGGGAFATVSSRLTLRNVAITENEAQLGGGIRSLADKLTIEDSTIAGNVAGEGGGIDLRSTQNGPSSTIRSSTISANSAVKGGGILADRLSDNPGLVGPALDLVNSTLAGNSTLADGGGVMADNGAVVALNNTTVAYNEANVDNNATGVGGGIHQHSGATFAIFDSIVDSNTIGIGGADPDCSGSFFGEGNVVTDTVGCSSLAPEANRFVSSANIGPLDQNGGPTETVKLLSGSPAIGFATTCPARDQRGIERPDTGCDSGAFERRKP